MAAVVRKKFWHSEPEAPRAVAALSAQTALGAGFLKAEKKIFCALPPRVGNSRRETRSANFLLPRRQMSLALTKRLIIGKLPRRQLYEFHTSPLKRRHNWLLTQSRKRSRALHRKAHHNFRIVFP